MKTAVVTGGTRGIGKSVVSALEKKGYLVYALYRTNEEAARVAKEEFPFVNFVRCDVSKEEEVLSFFSSLPRVDVLVNNAGVALVKQIQDTSAEDFFAVMNGNLTGTFLCSREAIKKMLKTGGGNIVNISSMWGEVGASCETAYSAAKGGVLAFTKALAKEVGYSSIRVNAVSPGAIETSMNDHLSEEEKKSLCEEIPAGRFGTGEEVAKAVLCLLENEYINGAVLSVNGGFVV